LLLAGCDGLIISDAGLQSKGVVSWPVSQKMLARLRQGGNKKNTAAAARTTAVFVSVP
jgi:hypothetical protein